MTQRPTIQAFPTPIRIATLLLSSPVLGGGASLHPLAHNLLARLIAFAPLHSPEFFAIIDNDVEIGVYAATEMMQRAMSEVQVWGLQQRGEGWIEVADEEWRVLQVDGEQVGLNGEQDGQYSSIHPVTASLADAGIHCKYQSSYYADFILVKDKQFAQTVALVRNCGWTVEDDSTAPNTPSPTASFCLRSPSEARGQRTDRYSTSSLPVVASNEWITYHDTAMTLGAADVKPRRRGARPHTADSVFNLGKGQGIRRAAPREVTDHRLSLALPAVHSDEVVPKANREEATCPAVKTKTQAEPGKRLGDDYFLPDEEDNGGKDVGNSLASSGVLSHLSMAVDFVPALESEFDNLAVSAEGSAENTVTATTRPCLQSMTIRISDDANTVPPATNKLDTESRPSTPDHCPPQQTFRAAVSVLESKIAVVGLNKETERQWEHRVQVFLNYPEEQARVVRNRYLDRRGAEDVESGSGCPEGMKITEEQLCPSLDAKAGSATKRPFVSYIRTEEGTSLSTEIPIIRSLFLIDEEREGLVQSGGELGMFDDDDEEEDTPHVEEEGRAWDRGSSRDQSSHHARDSSSCASSFRSRCNTSDSGYGSVFSTPAWSNAVQLDYAHEARGHTDNQDLGATCEYARRIERKPERGIKRCLQLDFRRGCTASLEGIEQVDDGLEQTKLVARVSGRLQSQGLGLLYASTYHSANIMVESRYLQAAQKVLEEVVLELDGEVREAVVERVCV